MGCVGCVGCVVVEGGGVEGGVALGLIRWVGRRGRVGEGGLKWDGVREWVRWGQGVGMFVG